MKRTKTLIATMAVGVLALGLAACSTPAEAMDTGDTSADTSPVVASVETTTMALGSQQGGGYGHRGGNGTAMADPAMNLPAAGEVDEQEIADLLWMREEEKLARDVYLTLGEMWDLPVFTQISQSEQHHMDSVLVLLDRYGLEDPVGDNEVGVFTNPDLQALYDELVARGSESAAEALLVGGAIEEIDIRDLEDALARTDNADIQQVYQGLENGSEHHLQAFSRMYEQVTGEAYTPQYLDQATYDAIMANSTGHGQGGHGAQNGHGGQQGGHGGQGGQGGHGNQGNHGGQGGHGNQGQDCNLNG